MTAICLRYLQTAFQHHLHAFLPASCQVFLQCPFCHCQNFDQWYVLVDLRSVVLPVAQDGHAELCSVPAIGIGQLLSFVHVGFIPVTHQWIVTFGLLLSLSACCLVQIMAGDYTIEQVYAQHYARQSR